MDNEISTTLAELNVKYQNTETKVYLQTELKENGNEGFRLILTDGKQVWEGTLTETNLDQLSTKRKMDFNSYVEQTRAAFTKENMSDLCFEYQLVPTGEDNAQFVWKKLIVGDDIRFQMGSMKLRQSDQPANKMCQVLSRCLIKTEQLQTQLHTLQGENERLSVERQNALKRLDKCVSAKEAVETELYCKFAAILNSKKERIRHLEENGVGESIEDEPEPTPSTSSATDTNRKPTRKRSPSLESDELDEEVSPKRARQTTTTVSRTSLASPSLNLGDDDDEDDGPKDIRSQGKAAPTTRPRRQGQGKKQTPSKPVLPRVSSGNSSANRSDTPGRRSSLRKSGSQNSNKSSDNLDPDDLLDNF